MTALHQMPDIEISTNFIPDGETVRAVIRISGHATIEKMAFCKAEILSTLRRKTDVTFELSASFIDMSFLQLISSAIKYSMNKGNSVNIFANKIFTQAAMTSGLKLDLSLIAEKTDKNIICQSSDIENTSATIPLEVIKSRLEALPGGLASSLADAAMTLKPQVVSLAIEAIAAADSELAESLKALADQFQYDAILDVVGAEQ